MAAPGRPDGCTRWPLWETPATPKGHSDHPQGGGTGHGDNPQQPSAGLHPRDSVWNPGQRGTHWTPSRQCLEPRTERDTLDTPPQGSAPWGPTLEAHCPPPHVAPGKGLLDPGIQYLALLGGPTSLQGPYEEMVSQSIHIKPKKEPISLWYTHTHTHTHTHTQWNTIQP